MEILILAGGLSHEREISLRSGRRVMEVLSDLGHRVTVRDVDAQLLPFLQDWRKEAHLVWPLLHGASGEDGSLQALLDLAGVRFVGTAAAAARVAWSKPVAKAVLQRAGIHTPAHVSLPQSTFREVGAEALLDLIWDKLGPKVVVKPARGGSALGVSVVDERADLARAMVHCFAYDELALVEKFISGVEVAVSVAGTGEAATALPPVEIVADGYYDYDARYNPGRVEYFTPARLAANALQQVSQIALAVHRELGLRDISRIDLIWDGAAAQVLDVNVAPGMTETSLYPQALLASGTGTQVYERILGIEA